MENLGRNKGHKIPKVVQQEFGLLNTVEDEVEVRRAVTMAEGKRFDAEKTRQEAEERDAEWERVNKIPQAASDLMVITTVKKLGAYIIAVTEKSPAKFRGVFVNRMQNFCLDALECLLQANFIRMSTQNDKTQRENFQSEAIIKLKMLGYIAMIAESVKCILARQYKQISIQLGEAVNMISAWRKSDDERWKSK